MMERAVNQFQKGLYTDYHPLTVQPDMLTDCLNGTIITNNGNEFMLQNDMGNVRVESARLPAGYVPIGTAELGGIVYVVSHNPFTKKCQIGSFPSPERNFTQDEINDQNIILDTEKYYESPNGSFPFSPDKSLKTNVTKLILLETLKVGEKYKVFSDNLQNFINNNWISGVCTNENDLNIHNNPRYLKLILVSIAENGKITYIDELVWDKITIQIPTGNTDENGKEVIKSEDRYYYIKPENLQLVNGKINLEEYRDLIDSNYNIASYKGFVTLGIVAQLECIDTFNVTWDALISDEVDNDGKKTNNKKAQLYWYLNWTYDNPIEEARNRVNPHSIYISDTDVNAKKENEEAKEENSSIPDYKPISSPLLIFYPYKESDEENAGKGLIQPDARQNYIYCVQNEVDIVEYPSLVGDLRLYNFDQERKNDGSDPEFILPHNNLLTYNPDSTNTERHNFDIIPRMPFGQMEWLKQSISLDLVKLGSGATDLIRWKYYKDEVGSTISLNWGLEAYPERNKKIKSVTLSFKKFCTDFQNIHKMIDGYEKGDEGYDTMEYNDKIGMFKFQEELKDPNDKNSEKELLLSKDVFGNGRNIPKCFNPKLKKDIDYEIEYKDLPSYSGLFTAKIPLTVAPDEDSFEGEKANTLDPDSVYLCQILINYNDEEYRVYYRFLFTSTIFNKEYFNEKYRDYKALTLTDYLKVNLGLSFDEGYPKISTDDKGNPNRITKVVSKEEDSASTGMDKVPTYQLTRGIREYYIKDEAKLNATFEYNITSDIPSLTFDLKENPYVELADNTYTQDSDYDMISSDLLLETPLKSTFRDYGEPVGSLESHIKVDTTVPYRVLYNKPATLSNLVELQNLVIYGTMLYDASWRDESRMWLDDGTYNKENPQLQVSDHGNQMVSFNSTFTRSLNTWFKNQKADVISLLSGCETVTTDSVIILAIVNTYNLTILSKRPPQGEGESRVTIFVFRAKDNKCTGLIYTDVGRNQDKVLNRYDHANFVTRGEGFQKYLKSLKKYVTLDEIIEVFESEHINYYNNPKVKISWKINTQGFPNLLHNSNVSYITCDEIITETASWGTEAKRENQWVIGYVVGYYKNNQPYFGQSTDTNTDISHILLSTNPKAENINECIYFNPRDISAGILNSMFGQQIYVYGDVTRNGRPQITENSRNYIEFKKVENISIEGNSFLPKNLTYRDEEPREIILNYYFTIPTYPIFLASLYTDQSEVYEVIERDPADGSIQDIRPLANDISKIYDSKNRVFIGFYDSFKHRYYQWGMEKQTPLFNMGGNFERNQYTKQLSFKQTHCNMDLGYRFVGEYENDDNPQVIQLNNLMLITPDTEVILSDSSGQEVKSTIRAELKEL